MPKIDHSAEAAVITCGVSRPAPTPSITLRKDLPASCKMVREGDGFFN